MADAKHTPTPWAFHELRGRSPDGLGYIRPVEEDGREVAHHGDMDRSREENLANAALIVRACNAHDELLAVAKRALNFVEYTEAGRGVVLVSGNELRAAIAKAEGAI